MHLITNKTDIYRVRKEEKNTFDTVLSNMDNIIEIAGGLWNIIRNYVRRNQIEKAEPYLRRILDLRDEHAENKRIQLYADIAQAIILKSSTRNRDKVRAQDIFENFVKVYDFDIELLLVALNHLVEILLNEYKLYNDNEVLEEIKGYIEKMYELAQDQHMVAKLIDVLILKSRLALTDNEFDRADALLTQAALVADENNLERYAKIVSEEISLMERDLDKMKQAIEVSSVTNRIAESRLMSYITKVRDTML